MPDSRSRSAEVIRSRQNGRVQEARRLARDPRLARREAVLVADGVILVREAIDAGLSPRWILVDPSDPDAASIRDRAARRGVPVALAARAVIEAVSTLATPQGAVGVFERPRFDPALLLAAADEPLPPVVAVLDGLQDPTNVGSLTRTALAAGISGIVTTEGTADPYHPRAVRASMGACFRMPIAMDAEPARLWERLRRGGYRGIGLDPRGTTDLADLRRDRATAIVLGREGSGLTPAARAACEISVRIPMANRVESLGVAAAGAIVFYVLSAARTS